MEEVLERGRRGPVRCGALETAVELLRELLADGPVASLEFEAAMLAEGYRWRRCDGRSRRPALLLGDLLDPRRSGR
jgi:hypothetical protein